MKHVKEVKYEYGDFLKAAGGQQLSPPSRSNGNSPGSSGDKPVQPTGQSMQPTEMSGTAVENFRSEIPSLHDKGELEILGKAETSG